MLSFISHALEFLNGISGPAVAGAGVVLEFVIRLFPSLKKLSIFYGLGAAFRGLGSLLTKAGELLDKVLPQNLKEPGA